MAPIEGENHMTHGPRDQVRRKHSTLASPHIRVRVSSAAVLMSVAVLLRGRHNYVILNKYPYNNGHLMIAPKRHGGDFGKLTSDETAEMMQLAQTWRRVIAGSMSADGFNIGLNLGRAAGCGVEDHLHLHIVPRWAGDTNFMPVLSDVHVVPQALLELYDELRAQLPDGAGAGPEGETQ